MAGERGKVSLNLWVEVPVRKPWDEQYVFDRLLSGLKKFQEEMAHQFGVKAIFDLTQEDHQGLIVRRECPHMIPGQESDTEGL